MLSHTEKSSPALHSAFFFDLFKNLCEALTGTNNYIDGFLIRVSEIQLCPLCYRKERLGRSSERGSRFRYAF